jgi:hypothetical protein
MTAIIYNLVIEQGADFNNLTFVLVGDYTAWLPRGQIRDDYASLGGTLKASFLFSPLILGEATLDDGTLVSGTLIRPSLTEIETRSLVQSKGLRWVYDIELQSPDGEVIRVTQGRVDISPEVTL